MRKVLLNCGLLLLGMLLTMGALFAQDDKKIYQDTLVLKLQGRTQVRIVGWSLKELAQYSAFDSLNALFWKDFEKEFSAKSESDWPQHVHYLVHTSGKRRMKVDELANQAAFSLEEEKIRLEEDLPAFHFVVYDLINNRQIHYYVENAAGIKELQGLKFDNFKGLVETEKENFKRNYRLDFSLTENQKIQNRRAGFGQLQIHPDIKLNVIGGVLIPEVGLACDLQFLNRFGNEKYNVGFVYTALAYSDFKDGRLGNIQVANSYELRFLMNMNPYGKEANWLGLELGYITYDKDQTNKFLGDQPLRYGLFTTVKSVGIGFGAIIDLKNSNRQSQVISLRLPF